MKHRTLALIVALTTVTGALVALPALAEGQNATQDETSAEGRGRPDHAAPPDDAPGARVGHHIRDAQMAHRDCVKAAVSDAANDTTTNGTMVADKVIDCNARFRGAVHDNVSTARERFAAKYADRVGDARARYAASDQYPPDDECKQDKACIERHVAHLEKRLEMAQRLDAHLENKLTSLEARHDNASADPNLTKAQLYRIQDKIYGVQIHLLQVERAIFRIEVKLESWNEALEALGDEDGATDDSG